MRRILAFLIFLALSPGAFAAGGDSLSPDQLDRLITDLRVNLFRQPVDAEGRPVGKPRLKPQDITPDLVKTLYGKTGALSAIARIFASRDYAEINTALGNYREATNLRVWSKIVDKYGIRIELNNAGKRNGAVSDLDNTLFTDASVLIVPETGERITDPALIHKFLVEEHGKVWEAELGVKPIAFDAMHFQGDGLMQDWRMSKRSLFQFVAQMESDIARLSAVDGAYFVPGAYKPQVYGRYLREAGTFVIEPSLDPKQVANRVDIEGAAGGVLIRAEARTRDRGASRLYRDIPFNLDRTGALGGVLGNFQYAEGTDNLVKEAKYGIRWIDSLVNSFTNLEVDWRHLVLSGKNAIRQYHVDKLFRDLGAKGLIPPEIGDTREARRVMDLMTRIELDKIIRGYKGKPRPGFWSDEWKAYVPREIDQAATKREYYAKEIEEIRRSLPPGEPPPTEDRLVVMAEEAFGAKVRAVARMAGAVAAKRVFADVFTRGGFARQVHLHGLEAAERLVAERVKGLHAALAFQTDEEMIRNIRDAAPPETRQMIDMIAEIAAAQRKTVLERGSITADELKLSNRALIRLLDQVSDPLRSQIPDEFAKRAIATILRNELLRTDKTYAERLLKSFRAEVSTYFNPLRTGSPKEFFLETGRNLWDIGTVDNVARIIAFNVQGKNDQALLEGVSAIAGAVPIAKDIWSLANGIKTWQKDDPSLINRAWPLAEFTALKAFTNLGGIPAEFATVYGFAKVLYGIEKSLFDIGWHFYGQPTQSEVVSWVLMGHPTRGIYVDPYEDRKQGIFSGILGKQSRFPAVPADAAALLSASAILKNRVKIPRFPPELIRKIMHATYRVRANKDTLAAGITTATPAGFQNARDRYLAEYLRKADYFLRRMYLYQAAHIAFFRYAQRFQKHFQAISGDPPRRYLAVPRDALRKSHPDAYRRVNGQDRWDHERIFLRDFFNTWLADWRKAQLPAHLKGVPGRAAEAGFFISTANNISGDWEKTVVDELMAAYFEGEMWDTGRPEDELRRHRELRAASGRGAKAGGDKMRERFDKQVAEARRKAYAKMKLLEALRWHPELRDRFVEAVMAAAKARAGAYKPKAPELRVKIPRPVARVGTKMVIEASVTGDVMTLPDDLGLEVTYRKVREHRKTRPAGVLRDDVRVLLGTGVKDEALTVHEHRANISLVSKSKPGFRLGPVTRTVYWLDGKPAPKELYVVLEVRGLGHNIELGRHPRTGTRRNMGRRVKGYEIRPLRIAPGTDPRQHVREVHAKMMKMAPCRNVALVSASRVGRTKGAPRPLIWDAKGLKITILKHGPYETTAEMQADREAGAFQFGTFWKAEGEATKPVEELRCIQDGRATSAGTGR